MQLRPSNAHPCESHLYGIVLPSMLARGAAAVSTPMRRRGLVDAVQVARRAMSTACVSLPSTMLLRRRAAVQLAHGCSVGHSPRTQTFTIYRYDPDEVGAKPKYQDYEINLDECGPMVRAPCTPQRGA